MLVFLAIAVQAGRPSVDCVRIVALENSRFVEPLLGQLKQLGLQNRTTVQYASLDQREGAGCWQQHVSAWRYLTAQGCRHSLVLEEDAIFLVKRWLRSSQIEDFIALNRTYDTLQLGMWHNGIAIGRVIIPAPSHRPTWFEPLPEVRCMARSVGDPGASHAYVISAKAAAAWRPRWGSFGTVHIDQWMKWNPLHQNFVVLPSMVFQRHHESQNMKSPITRLLEPAATGNTRTHAFLERKFFYKMPGSCWRGKPHL
jgi:hypothetical protein